ncbi:NmrA-like family protein [Aspergillus karnatakaensis]|uniref:NmrA-like family protein n=1 Tax=Aspergillus karnatakaensis TaxID=1810916 RepID=UPI003CCDFA10
MASSVIAVAGGSGSLGKTLVEELVLAGKHQVVVLSRHGPKPGQDGVGKLKTVKINYDSIESIQNILEANNIDTVISTLWIYDEATYQSQDRLIDAATQSSCTKRFIAGEFAAMMNEEYLRKSGLQWTRIANGFVMDYYGRPHIKTNMPPSTWILDVENCSAVVPGTGEEVITFTYTYDVARAVVLLLDLCEWPEYSLIGGDDVTANQMIRVAEEARGRKFNVTYQSEKKVYEQWQATWTNGEPDVADLVIAVNLMAARGQMQLPQEQEQRLNEKLPGFAPTRLERLIREAWTGR